MRHCPKHGRHSAEAVDLVKEFVNKLEDIQVHDAELFPYDTIVELKKEYLMTDCNRIFTYSLINTVTYSLRYKMINEPRRYLGSFSY